MFYQSTYSVVITNNVIRSFRNRFRDVVW